ncbi:hypothetical protein [Streptomyces spiralis]|nr:hypothetical protein [Streptomyces spiralis]
MSHAQGLWADLMRDCSRQDMRAPVLAVGDGAQPGAIKAVQSI